MSEYFIYVISVLATVAFCSFVSYGGEGARYTRFALGAVLLCALTVPTVAHIKNLSRGDISFPDTQISESYTDEVLKEAYAKGIERAIAERFSLAEDSVAVVCRGFSVESVSADFLYVTLCGEAAFSDVPRIRSYVNEKFGECEVAVKFD
jgi:hypothetical protein